VLWHMFAIILVDLVWIFYIVYLDWFIYDWGSRADFERQFLLNALGLQLFDLSAEGLLSVFVPCALGLTILILFDAEDCNYMVAPHCVIDIQNQRLTARFYCLFDLDSTSLVECGELVLVRFV
jgi:hypothetical protein